MFKFKGGDTLARVSEVAKYAIEHGNVEASETFDISEKTVRNYKGLYNSYLALHDEIDDTETKAIHQHVRILILDIETAPTNAYVWRMWKQNVAPNQIVDDWFMLTWAAKWLGSSDVMSDALDWTELIDKYDYRITKSIYKLIDEADIVIAHNGDKFDLPKLNTRFLVHGFTPPSPYQSIDTLRTLRKTFGFSHNRMDYVNKVLGLNQKIDTGGMELWVRCLNADEDAIEDMRVYNINDVKILEELYLKMRPWIKPHPNVGMIFDSGDVSRCHVCGSTNLVDTGNLYNTSVNMYPVFTCNNCGAHSRGRSPIKGSKQRENLLSPVAR